MLDGFTNYIELMNKYDIKTTFFVLSEIVDIVKEQLLYAVSCGHEIACHGKTHIRPIDLSLEGFEREITEAKAKLEDTIGQEVVGYRAPCFGIDDERYKIVKKVGFKYSSSKMDIIGHPLYGELDLTSFDRPVKGIFAKDGMIEFALATQKFCGRHIAISGGGWIRLLPWTILMKPLITKYLKNAESYTLYIHPFELSRKTMPKVPGVGLLTDIRARRGLGKVDGRIEQLIMMLKKNGFSFGSFAEVRKQILAAEVDLAAIQSSAKRMG